MNFVKVRYMNTDKLILKIMYKYCFYKNEQTFFRFIFLKHIIDLQG